MTTSRGLAVRHSGRRLRALRTAPIEARAALAISPSVRSGSRAISKSTTAAERSLARSAVLTLCASGLLDGLLHRPLAAADEAVVEALFLHPVGRRRCTEAFGPAARHLTARAGELHDCIAVGWSGLGGGTHSLFLRSIVCRGAAASGPPASLVLRSSCLGWGPIRPDPSRAPYVTGRLRRYATSRSFCASASVCSFFSDWFSICRIRSRVTLNVRPTSSSVRGCSPPSP